MPEKDKDKGAKLEAEKAEEEKEEEEAIEEEDDEEDENEFLRIMEEQEDVMGDKDDAPASPDAEEEEEEDVEGSDAASDAGSSAQAQERSFAWDNHRLYSEDTCQVCMDSNSYEQEGDDDDATRNLLVFCDNCNVPVHEKCYALEPAIVTSPYRWYCSSCSTSPDSTSKSRRALTDINSEVGILAASDARFSLSQCALCPWRGGPVIRSTDGRSVHVLCAIQQRARRGLVISDESIVDLSKIMPPSSRAGAEECCVCEQVDLGAGCVRCTVGGCDRVFHPLCALHVGSALDFQPASPKRPTKRMKRSDGGSAEGGSGGGAALYCDEHALDHGHREAGKGEEEDVPRPTELEALPLALEQRLQQAAARLGAEDATTPPRKQLASKPALTKASTPRSKIMQQAADQIERGERFKNATKVLVIFLQETSPKLDMLYEATTLKSRDFDDGSVAYKVHYKGWKASKDEWVEAKRVVIDNDQNRVLLGQLREAKKALAEGAPRGTTLLKLAWPPTLREHVVCEDVETPLKLPRVPSITTIMEDYAFYMQRKDRAAPQAEQDYGVRRAEVIKWLQGYIESTLSGDVEVARRLLLHSDAEAKQLRRLHAKHPGKKMAELCGPEHLLRFLVRLPEILQQANASSECVRELTALLGASDGGKSTTLFDFMESKAAQWWE